MPDDIFDYFGGNSSRKVEPLDESEMFDDLLPGKDEPEAAAETAEDAPVEIIEAELIQASDDHAGEKDAEPVEETEGTVSQADVADDPWNDLASSLGLEPTPAPVKEESSAAAAETPVENIDEEPASEAEPEEIEAPTVHVFKEEDLDDDEEEDETKSKEVLSEMFVPTEDPEAYSRREPIDDLEDDPFAAFSGASQSAAVEADEPEAETFDEPELTAEPSGDADFVEFEVTDLGGRVDEDREERTHRRPKRRRRGRDDDDGGESDDRQSRQRHDQEQPRGDAKKRRGRRRSRDTAEPRDDSRRDRDDDTRSRDRDQDRNRKRDRGRDSETDDRDKKKKPRIPTWQEAIGVVVDENIKRHESNSNSGRGGKRRRRN